MKEENGLLIYNADMVWECNAYYLPFYALSS